jgi:hypothetical protein
VNSYFTDNRNLRVSATVAMFLEGSVGHYGGYHWTRLGKITSRSDRIESSEPKRL